MPLPPKTVASTAGACKKGASRQPATDPKPSIFLVGPMGAGKTTVGRQLADLLARPFIDSDQEIEARTGASIPWIFEKEGEHGFRQREEGVIDRLTRQPEIVLATGGGAVTRQKNCEALHQRGIVVYLYTPVEMQLARTARDRHRPLLQVADPALTLSQLLAVRDPLYRQVAHYIVPTSDGSARDLAQKIIHLIGLNTVR